MSACAMETEPTRISYCRSRGVGDAAVEVQRQAARIERAVPGSFAKFNAAVANLLAAVAECNARDWDGYDAEPANSRSARHAMLLLSEVLIVEPHIPHVTIDPDGEVAFEWRSGHQRVFSVSVGQHGELTYAGLFDGSKIHGVETRMADGLPREIRAGIHRVYTAR